MQCACERLLVPSFGSVQQYSRSCLDTSIRSVRNAAPILFELVQSEHTFFDNFRVALRCALFFSYQNQAGVLWETILANRGRLEPGCRGCCNRYSLAEMAVRRPK